MGDIGEQCAEGDDRAHVELPRDAEHRLAEAAPAQRGLRPLEQDEVPVGGPRRGAAWNVSAGHSTVARTDHSIRRTVSIVGPEKSKYSSGSIDATSSASKFSTRR